MPPGPFGEAGEPAGAADPRVALLERPAAETAYAATARGLATALVQEQPDPVTREHDEAGRGG